MLSAVVFDYENDFKRIDLNDYGPGTTHRVQVLHIDNPGNFFVRPVEYNAHVKKLEAKGKAISCQEVVVRKRVVYYSKTLKEFVRGDIESASFDTLIMACSIYATDYGCRDNNVDLDDIYLPENIMSIVNPPLIMHCELYSCLPLGEKYDDNAGEIMKYFVGSRVAQMTVQCINKKKLMVELHSEECPINLPLHLAYLKSSKLFLKSYAVTNDGSPNISVVRYRPRPVKVGDKLFVRVQNAKSILSFHVAEYNDYKNYIKEAGQFSEYFKREAQQDVESAARDARCCLIKHGKPPSYERGCVQRVVTPHNSCLVQLIDWGQEIEVNFKDVRQASFKYYTEQPAIAIHCTSTPDQMWNNGMPRFFYPGYQFIIEVVELGIGDLPHKVNLIGSQQIY